MLSIYDDGLLGEETDNSWQAQSMDIIDKRNNSYIFSKVQTSS
jgi:hypothetical protein